MNQRKRRWGDRKDGRRIRSLPPFNNFIPYIMPTRNDASNYYEESFEIAAMEQFLHNLRAEGYKGIGSLHFIIASYVRCVAEFPGINRFVVGRRIYARNNIEVVMTVKRDMSLDGEETTIKVVFAPTDTIIDVYRKLNEKIEEIKNNSENNNTERVATILCRMPRWLLRSILGILRSMDYYGLLPQALVDASPFHGSMIITDLGSLGIGPIYHHIYNFGVLPVFVSFGTKRRCCELNCNGQVERHRYLDCKFVLDERIADGFYYAKFLRNLRRIFRNPEMLELPPKLVVKDIP